MQWDLMKAGEEENVQERPGESTNIPGRFTGDASQLEWYWHLAEWPVIKVGGKVSSPNAPAGVRGSKSKV